MMKGLLFIFGLIACTVVILGSDVELPDGIFDSDPFTAVRINKDGYPVEIHEVQTQDSYILKMFRIPYSRKLNNENTKKPVVFVQHGLLSSSDCWILNGPDNALAYLLADAGYDVWLGNVRGNTYSRKNSKYSTINPKFWKFSWNEMGQIDIPDMIDYILFKTGEPNLHYVGHSQGTTVYFVMLSNRPEYNSKIKTGQMLAPIAIMENMQTPLAKVGGPLLGKPNILSKLIGDTEFLPNSQLLSMLGAPACHDKSPIQDVCSNVLFLIAGWDQEYLNTTLLPDIVKTHPAGSSSNQMIHYLQEYNSGFFCKFDYGKRKNKSKYDSKKPPEYIPSNIKAATYFYYANNDLLAACVDVEKFAKMLPNLKQLYKIPIDKYNHLDFLWSINVKEQVYDPLLKSLADYENLNK